MSYFSSMQLEIYPEKKEKPYGALDRVEAGISGLLMSRVRPGKRLLGNIIEKVHEESSGLADLSYDKLRARAEDLRPLLRRNGFETQLVGRAFALIREMARRTLNMSHYDVQLMGGMVLLKGMVAEMETGEGKTLVATLPAATAALSGIPVHIITVNDYLSKRDSEWMGPVYRGLGLSVGTVHHGMSPEEKKTAYRCDVTYCTNKELAFDYLRDRIVLWDRPGQTRMQLEKLYGHDSRMSQLLLRGLHYAIVDEADSILVDESRTPLIISSEAEGLFNQSVYEQAIAMARYLTQNHHYVLVPGERKVNLTPRGEMKINAFDWEKVDFKANEEQRQELIKQALAALHLYMADKHYLVRDGKIHIIDEFTGRLMADRSWERGLHQLIEVKEGCEITLRKDTKARISYQRFFRRYRKLAGMTGSAREVAGEMWRTYRMPVVAIPANRPVQRKYLPGNFFRSSNEKWKAVLDTVSLMHQKNRPVLVGTRSVDASEYISSLLSTAGIPHRVLNARQDREEAEIIALAGQPGRITVATNMAGRGTDILLGKGVSEQGGLHVIATEMNESHRIDRQLFGRCGRQGDPGSCELMVSFEDELISSYGGRILPLVSRLVMRTPDALLRFIGMFLIRRSQKAAERLHRGMRRDLLKMDEQISDSLAFTGRLE